MIEATLPFSTQHERAFISCLLQEPHTCVASAANAFGSENPCYVPAHAYVYDAIISMDIENVQILTVMDVLTNNRCLDAVGGMTGLRELANAVPSTADFNLYMKWVTKLYQQRRLLASIDKMRADLFDPRAKVDQIVDASEVALRRAMSVSSFQTIVGMGDACEDAVRGLDEEIHTIKTGFPVLDQLIGDIPVGSFMLLAARPGCGKTTLAGNIAVRHAGVGTPVYFASLEMPRRQLLGRWVCSLTDTYSNRLRDPDRRNLVMGGYDMLSKLPLYIDDKPSLSLSEFIRKCKRLKAEHGVKLVVLDYLQRMNLEPLKNENRDQTVSRAAAEIKNCLLEHEMVGLVLAQLNRDAAMGAPAVHHLRESGGLEQEADHVFLLHSEKLSKEELGPINKGLMPQKIQCICGKNRHGPCGVVDLEWWKAFSRFEGNVVGDEYVPS